MIDGAPTQRAVMTAAFTVLGFAFLVWLFLFSKL